MQNEEKIFEKVEESLQKQKEQKKKNKRNIIITISIVTLSFLFFIFVPKNGSFYEDEKHYTYDSGFVQIYKNVNDSGTGSKEIYIFNINVYSENYWGSVW